MKKNILLQILIINCFISISQTDYFTDERDGKVYKTVKIRDQIWMAENLKTTFYFDGTPIELISSNENWSESLFGYSYYNFNETIQKQNGNLYKYFTATDVCPFNWHLPTNEDWDKMLFTLGNNKTDYHLKSRDEEVFLAGNELKIVDPTLWQFWEREDGEIFESNQEITNSSHFSATPSGYRYSDGSFVDLGQNTWFWSADSDLNFSNDNSGLTTYSLIFKRDHVIKNTSPDFVKWGASIRCVKDDFNSNLTKVHDSINQNSFSKQNWKSITTYNEVVSLNARQFKSSKSAQIVLDALKQSVSLFEENNTYISSLSKDKRYCALTIKGKDNIYFVNLMEPSIDEIEINYPSAWLSWSPNQTHVLFKNYQSLYIYDIVNKRNTELVFDGNSSKSDIGNIEEYEFLSFDFLNINWISGVEFEVIGDVYAGTEHVLQRSLIYTYDIEKNQVTKILELK